MHIVFLYIICGIIAGGIAYFLIDAFLMMSAKKKLHFNETEKKVKSQLIEKEENYEKEKKAEISNKIAIYENTIQQQYEERLFNFKEQLKLEEEKYSAAAAEYRKKNIELDKQYQNTIAIYAELDKQREIERTAKNEQQIQNKHQEYLLKLRELEKDYETKKGELCENFQNFSESINSQKAILAEEIKAYEDKQKNIIKQLKHDEEVKLQRDFYKISISNGAHNDVQKLKTLAESFSKPEVLLKLLYEVYYKPSLEELFKRVLGENRDKGGIYKITNINNEKIYIGKTTNFLSRWRTHAKRGCGIERIKGRLYDAMFEEGLENFTWEIVELCSKEQQTEKEKYWINFYKTIEYGYNMKDG